MVILILNVSIGIGEEEQELRSELLKLSDVKEEMNNAGMGVTRVNDLITEGFLQFNNNNFNKTKEIIDSIYNIRDAAFNAQHELADVNQAYLYFKERNISLISTISTTSTKLELDLDYAQREYEKENYEGALQTLAKVMEVLLSSINIEYGYLNDTLTHIEEKTISLDLSKSIVVMLKSLLSEALETGKLQGIEIIEQDIMDLNKSLAYYQEIKALNPAFEAKNLSTQRIDDELESIEIDNLIQGDYETALFRLQNIKELGEKALELSDEINELEERIAKEKEKQADLKQAKTLLKEAEHELMVGNYELAMSKLASAMIIYESTKAGFLVKKASSQSFGMSIKEFIEKNWSYILIVFLIILVVFITSRKALIYGLRRKKIAKLNKELVANENMVKKLQKDYFKHKKMGRDSYDESYDRLQERIMKIKDRLSQLNKKVNKRK